MWKPPNFWLITMSYKSQIKSWWKEPWKNPHSWEITDGINSCNVSHSLQLHQMNKNTSFLNYRVILTWLGNEGSVRGLTFQSLFLLMTHKLKVLEMLLFLKDLRNTPQNKFVFHHYSPSPPSFKHRNFLHCLLNLWYVLLKGHTLAENIQLQSPLHSELSMEGPK